MRQALLLAGLLAAAPAAAQERPTDVSPLVVYPQAKTLPKMVASFPKAGQAVPAGVLVLALTFDQPMTPARFDVTAGPGGALPPCLKVPRRLNDEKTFVLLCTTRPNTAYALAVNAGAAGGFANLAGQRAEPAVLAFSTNAERDGPRTVEAAVKAAGLGALDMPVQETPDLPKP